MTRPRGSVRGGRLAAAALVTLATLATAACEGRNRGVSPVGVGMYFPSGVALDPRVPDDEQARWLFVLNGNSDLVYNAGSIMPIDLDAFFDAWMMDAARCFAGEAEMCRPGTGVVGEGGVGPVVADVGTEPTEDVPCRRNAYKPQLIECEDTFFIEEDAAVHVGNFGRSLVGWSRWPLGEVPEGEEQRHALFAAVRGDPSVTYVELSGDPQDIPTLECGRGSSGLYDQRRCGGDYLLRFLRNDPDTLRIASEPSNILATPGSPYVLVTHATRPAMTLIDMDGQYDAQDKSSKDDKPAIVQMRSLFEIGGTAGGGWGMALRPCGPGNVPALTVGHDENGDPKDCQRPLIYAGFRTALYVVRTFIAEVEPLSGYIDFSWLKEEIERAEQRKDELVAERNALDPEKDKAKREALRGEIESWESLILYYKSLEAALDQDDNGVVDSDSPYMQQCLLAADVVGDALTDEMEGKPDTTGAFLCDARLYGAGLFRAAAFDTGVASSTSLLGDLAFSADGNRLFVVQTNPGGLAYVDTSLDSDGGTRDQSAGLVELCAQPTGLMVFSDGENEYAAVTCYKPQEMFIVDLKSVQVIANVTVGTGPHPMAVDPARDLMYIANTLDRTVSVVDLSPRRPTRFIEIARIGRQVPYNR